MADGLGSSYWVQRIIRLAEAEGAKLHHPVVLMHTQCGLPGLPGPEITSRAFPAPRTAAALARAMLLVVSMHHGPFGLTACRVRREHDATGGSWDGPMSPGGW